MGSLFKHVWLRSPSSDTALYDMDPPLDQPLLAGDAKKEVIHDLPQLEKCEFRIQGMNCGACVEVSKVFANSSGQIDYKSAGY